MSAGNRPGPVRAARSELFVGAGTCEEVDKTCGGSARSRTVPGRTQARAWPRRTGREPVERFALRGVSRGFQSPGASAPDPAATRQGVPRNARWRHNPSRSRRARATPAAPAPTPTPGRQQSPHAWPGRIAARLAPVADSCANSEIAARRARRSVLARLFAIGLSAVLHSAQNSRGTRKERGHDQHRATVF